MNIRVCTLLSALLLAGCSTFPDKLKLEDNVQLASYQQATSNAEQVKGKLLRWGGAIAKVENKPNKTIFEMVHYPINNFGKPNSQAESTGRFRVEVEGFMDPMVYQIGRLMTFTGELNGLEKGLVGEHEYTYPVANVKGYHLWKNVQRIDINSFHAWPYQHWYYPRHYRRNVMIRNTNRSASQRGKVLRPQRVTNYSKPIKTRREEK